MTDTPNDRDEFRHFFDFAFQYYAAGRYAAFAGLIPVCGNLLHHAIEMYLKGALAKRGATLGELRRLNHDLNKIWNAFKIQCGDTSINKYDRTISELHAHEKIRYPDFLIAEGMASTIHIGRGEQPENASGRLEPQYHVRLAEIDDLFAEIIRISGVNPKFFTAGMRAAAREYLEKE